MSTALRSFRAYTNVAPVSPSINIDPTGTLTKPLNFPCSLVNFDGAVGTGGGYLQVFDSAIAPVSTTTVPLKSVRIEDDGSGGVQHLPSYMPSLGPITLNNGLYFAMSSTEAVYTALATNFDIWGEVVEFEGFVQPDALTLVGDTITGLDHRRVWTEASGPHKLVEAIVTDLGLLTATRYIMLFATDSQSNGDVPIEQWTVVNGTSYDFKFGRDGIDVESQDRDYTRRKGCTLWLSDTTGSLTKPSTGSGDTIAIKAYYK